MDFFFFSKNLREDQRHLERGGSGNHPCTQIPIIAEISLKGVNFWLATPWAQTDDGCFAEENVPTRLDKVYEVH